MRVRFLFLHFPPPVRARVPACAMCKSNILRALFKRNLLIVSTKVLAKTFGSLSNELPAGLQGGLLSARQTVATALLKMVEPQV